MTIQMFLALISILSVLAIIVCFILLIINIIAKKGKEKKAFVVMTASIILGFFIVGATVVVYQNEEKGDGAAKEIIQKWAYQTDFLYSHEVEKTGSTEWLDVETGSFLYSVFEYTFGNRISDTGSFMFSLINTLNTPTKDGQGMMIHQYFQKVYEGSYLVFFYKYDDIRVNDEIIIEYKYEKAGRGRRGEILVDKEKNIMWYTGSDQDDVKKFIFLYNAYAFAFPDTPINEEQLEKAGIDINLVTKKADEIRYSREEPWDLLFNDLQTQFHYGRQRSAIMTNIILDYMVRNSL